MPEFPASRFMDMTLVVPDQLRQQNFSALYLKPSYAAAKNDHECLDTAPGRQACTVTESTLAEAGFVLVAVAGKEEDESAAVEQTRKWWRTVSPCS